MFRRTVTDPHGRTWKIGRRWLPKRPRFARADIPDVGPGNIDLPGDDLGVFGIILGAIVGIVVVVVLALLLFNVIAIALELLIVIVVALAGVIGRVVFRRPWTVFARSGDQRYETRVVGYLNSRRTIEDVSSRLALGTQLEAPAGDR
jgi:hypothetical protein